MFVNNFIFRLFKKRIESIDRLRKKPEEAQEKLFLYLVKRGAKTKYGLEYSFKDIKNVDDFRKNVPVSNYSTLQPYIDRMRRGEKNVLWDAPVKWFAKSSGTTAGKSKFIPVSGDSLYNCHLSGGKDVTLQYLLNNPKSKLLLGHSLTLGGSRKIDEMSNKIKSGDLSAIMIHNSPWYAEFVRTPSKNIAMIPDFNVKTIEIAKYSSRQNVTSFAGVPSWNLVLMNRILEYTQKSSLLDIWSELEVFFHGGVAFAPYIEQFRKIIPSEKMQYMETYNASEGFFAMQDDPRDDAMLLLTGNGIFFEFLPVSELNSQNPEIHDISNVKTGINYALLITTNAGLWRYLIGDTVKFTSLYPHKIKITGRTSQYINVFGEELIVANADEALKCACAETGAIVSEYTVAPVFMTEFARGRHEWLVEFNKYPDDVERFADILDKSLCSQNSDYEAKRTDNTTLLRLKLTALPTGSFIKWMELRGKLGGQNKIPRLSNSREYADQLISIIQS